MAHCYSFASRISLITVALDKIHASDSKTRLPKRLASNSVSYLRIAFARLRSPDLIDWFHMLKSIFSWEKRLSENFEIRWEEIWWVLSFQEKQTILSCSETYSLHFGDPEKWLKSCKLRRAGFYLRFVTLHKKFF